MDVYKEVFANLRSEMENFVQELDEGDADAMLQIVDGFASLSDGIVLERYRVFVSCVFIVVVCSCTCFLDGIIDQTGNAKRLVAF